MLHWHLVHTCLSRAIVCLILTIVLCGSVGLLMQHTRHVPTEAETHPPVMHRFPPRDMLDWSEHDDPPGLCPDFHHLDV